VTVYTINPLTDVRWSELVDRHPKASVFHTRGWLQALEKTYGYTPVVFTTAAPYECLQNGLACCQIKSWITGERLVSLPFSDHCDLLANSESAASEILCCVREHILNTGFRYAEFRPTTSECFLPQAANLETSKHFFLHFLSLDQSLETLFCNLHKNCIQRKIRRAERERLTYKIGREALLCAFYELLVRTRRRHGLPPQPFEWFRNILKCLGNGATIRAAYLRQQPVSAIMTLSHGQTVVYKYACSDERHNQLGGPSLLLWKAIQEAKESGMKWLDLGRSDTDSPSLVIFKDRLGATKVPLQYYRYYSPAVSVPAEESQYRKRAQRLIPFLPDKILAIAGKLLYKHIG